MSRMLTGQTLGDYLVGPFIGGGAMGEVYQGFSLVDVNQRVALKVLREEYAKDVDFSLRFVREVKLLEALSHPNIIPIYEHGTSNGMLYFVMKLINGATLSFMMQRQRFSPLTAWDILQPLASALHYGHLQGAYHRDVKPSNIFLERDGEAIHLYLGDFGLGKKPDLNDTLTRAGTSIGTPEYMSPESAMGEALDARTDVYSLAVILYEMLVGVLPFKKRSPELTAVAHIRDTVPMPSIRIPDFPAAIQQVLLLGLEKDRDKRCQTAQAFAEAYYEALISLPPQEQTTEYAINPV